MARAPTSAMNAAKPVSPTSSGLAPNWKSQSSELLASAMKPSRLAAV